MRIVGLVFFSVVAVCLLAGVCISTVISSASDPVIRWNNVPLEVMIYQNGRPAQVGSLSADSEGVAAIQALLKTKTGRWRTSYVTYVPFIYVRSHDFRLNIHNNLIIMNYRVRDGNFTQVVSDLAVEEFEQVSRAISESFLSKSEPR